MKFFIFVLILLSTHLVASPLIIGGENVDKEPLIERSTVSLVTKYKGVLTSFCSGTVIGKSIILTAAHCIAILDNSDLYISFGKDVRLSDLYEVSKFKYYYSGYFQQSNEGDLVEGRDIALLITKKELPLMPVELGDPSNLISEQRVFQAGYGLISEENEDTEVDLNSLGFLFMLFTNAYSHISERSIYVVENANHKVAGGDSGGPLFSKEYDKLILHGILSQSGQTINTDDNGDRSVDSYFALYTHPYHFQDWMNCALPDSLKIKNDSKLISQIACDEQPFLNISDIASFNSEQCKSQRPGFNITEKHGCWPVIPEACKLFSEEIHEVLLWDDTNKECVLDDK